MGAESLRPAVLLEVSKEKQKRQRAAKSKIRGARLGSDEQDLEL